MSRGESELKQRIVDRALELFNEHGTIAIGMRELARDLQLSPGNLTYHFARKEDLLIAIADRLSAANSQTLQELEQSANLGQFLEALRRIFNNHYRFRCLMLNLVYLLDTFPTLAAGYRENQLRRTAAFERILLRLQAGGALRADVDAMRLRRLAGYCTLIGRFWLSEYWIDAREQSLDQAIVHYLGLLAIALQPYATEVGNQELQPYLA